MSLLLTYQGFPPESGFVDLVRSLPPEQACGAQFVSFLLECGIFVADKPQPRTSVRPKGRQPGAGVPGQHIKPAPGQEDRYRQARGEDDWLWDWCCVAVARFPELAERSLCINKDYYWLPFLLSASARRAMRRCRPERAPRPWEDPEGPFDEVIEQAFHAPPIAPGVVAGQGVAIGLIPAHAVEDIGLYVGTIGKEAVMPHIAELVDLCYDGWSSEFRTEIAERKLKVFLEFQSFFVTAAEAGEEVMVVVD